MAPNYVVWSTNTNWASWNTSATNSWSSWNYNFNTTDSSYQTTVLQTWSNWNTTGYRNVTLLKDNAGGYSLPVQTPEEAEAARAAQAERVRVAKEVRAERERLVAEAKERARVLLLSVLDEEQTEELEKSGHFHVETANGTRRYKLTPGSGPIRVHGEDGHLYSYCIHPSESFQPDDTVIAQKLLLEANEEEFLRIANARRLTGPVRV